MLRALLLFQVLLKLVQRIVHQLFGFQRLIPIELSLFRFILGNIQSMLETLDLAVALLNQRLQIVLVTNDTLDIRFTL